MWIRAWGTHLLPVPHEGHSPKNPHTGKPMVPGKVCCYCRARGKGDVVHWSGNCPQRARRILYLSMLWVEKWGDIKVVKWARSCWLTFVCCDPPSLEVEAVCAQGAICNQGRGACAFEPTDDA